MGRLHARLSHPAERRRCHTAASAPDARAQNDALKMVNQQLSVRLKNSQAKAKAAKQHEKALAMLMTA